MTVSDVKDGDSENEPLVYCESLTKIFKGVDSSINLVVLKSINLSIEPHTFTAILGPSGSGKTTFLNVLSGITSFQGGQLLVDGILLNDLKLTHRSSYWRNKISFVFQFPENNVFMNLTVFENLKLSGSVFVNQANFDDLVDQCLQDVNLKRMRNRKIKTLSGGELQKLAIAMALIRNTPILLADEPTGELDTENSLKIFELLKDISHKKISTCIIVSHDKNILRFCDQAYLLENGILSELKQRDSQKQE